MLGPRGFLGTNLLLTRNTNGFAFCVMGILKDVRDTLRTEGSGTRDSGADLESLCWCVSVRKRE